MYNEVLETILKDTYTVNKLKLRLRILKSYFLKALFGGEAEKEALDQSELNWLNSVPPFFYQKFNKDNVYALFKQAEDKINQLLPVVVYLPFEANDQSIAQIGQFARITFNNTSLLLDIKHDPGLIAGCALVWNGVYRDYSLRAKIEERKAAILQSFKKFLR